MYLRINMNLYLYTYTYHFYLLISRLIKVVITHISHKRKIFVFGYEDDIRIYVALRVLFFF